jgi:hypothetical protein
MAIHLNPGEEVAVSAFGGRTIQRVVVKDLGATVIVCDRAEYDAAQKDNREPQGIGFPKADVIRRFSSQSAKHSVERSRATGD